MLALNREELRRARYADYRTFAMFHALLARGIDAQMDQKLVNEIRVMQGRTRPFAGMKRYFARQWGLPGPY